MTKETQFQATIEANKDRIYRICCCYVRDEHQRNDVYQEALIHIWKSLDSFQGKSEIGTWIYRVVVNTCLGHIRSENRRKRVFHETSIGDHQAVFAETPSGDESGQEEEIRKMYDCIDQLPEVEKTLVSLYLEDLSTADMAEVLGISESNVRVKIHRIKKRLREMMKGDEHGS